MANYRLSSGIITSDSKPFKPDLLCNIHGTNIFLSSAPGRNKTSSVNKNVIFARNLDTDIMVIRSLHIRHIFCLMEDFEFSKNKLGNYPVIMKKKGFDISHYSVVDHNVPTLELMYEMVLEMHQCLTQKKDILIHCMGGVGRTGTLAACFLVTMGYEPHLAISAVQEKRKGAIKRQNQQDFVREFAVYFHARQHSSII